MQQHAREATGHGCPPRPPHALVLLKREQIAVKNAPRALAHAAIQTILDGIPEKEGSVAGREVGGANRANKQPPRPISPVRYPTPPKEGSVFKLQLSGASLGSMTSPARPALPVSTASVRTPPRTRITPPRTNQLQPLMPHDLYESVCTSVSGTDVPTPAGSIS